MSTLPFSDQQCFFVAILAFIVLGFYRGWRRELISLVFVLIAVILVQPGTSGNLLQFLERLPGAIGVLLTGRPQSTGAGATGPFLGAWGTLLIFALIVALGYYIGTRAFPKPVTPTERFIGVVPALVSGFFVLGYLRNFVGQSLFTVAIQPPDPANYVPVILVIAIISVVIGLIAARSKKSAPPAKK
jgi:hypothetical protein